MIGKQAYADRRRGEDFRSIDEEWRFEPLQGSSDILSHFVFAVDGAEQKQELVAADAGQHVVFAQVEPEPFGDLDQQRIADRGTVVVVDVLEIIDIEKGERK